MTRKSVVTIKYAKTIKEYKTHAYGWDITIPAGSHISNATAEGPDDNYRHWRGWQKVIHDLTGFPNSTLAHDIEYRGINIPAEYCEPWSEAPKMELSEDDKKHREANLKMSFTETYEAPYNLVKARKTISLLKDAIIELRHQVRLIPCEQYTPEMHDAMVAAAKAIDEVGEIAK